ncbi:MAG: hypothetical protein ICV60_02910 [Pyrinomonadaceae bacterium]|nr:hypothetical protein [Pyrinomonadaceae bacterium]
MKNLRQLFAGLVLTLALTSTAFAGQVECPGITQDPPPQQESVAGDIQNGVTGDLPNGGQSINTDATTLTMLELILVTLSVV